MGTYVEEREQKSRAQTEAFLTGILQTKGISIDEAKAEAKKTGKEESEILDEKYQELFNLIWEKLFQGRDDLGIDIISYVRNIAARSGMAVSNLIAMSISELFFILFK